jgi:hypothetical protein
MTIASGVAETKPQLAALLAPESPAALVATSMAQIGEAAAKGGNPDSETTAKLGLLGATSPLEPEPFLVEAALAERSGDYGRAERLLRQARWRNPRSTAARYLLADVWLRENKIVEGLGEMATLTRLLPSASVQLVPALAEYARSPGAREKLVTILQPNPQLKRPLLNALAADPDNAELILSLAGPDARSTDKDAQSWKARLLAGFVKRNDFVRAYSLWRAFAGLAPGSSPLLFNGNFSASPAPPPFNWSYNSSSAGVAEPGGGKVRILYYGRDDSSLVSQILLLKPGAYAFVAPVSGTPAPNALAWTLTCIDSNAEIMNVTLSGDSTAAKFTVPAGCTAQMLSLNGRSQDMPQDSDIQIGPVTLERTGA